MTRSIVLCALNSRFSHTGLAIRCISSYLQENWPTAPPLLLIEETIHEPPLRLLRQLLESRADIYAFSCYIWNITLVRTLSRQLRRLRPQAVIVWGGPEAGSDAEKWLTKEPAVDYIIRGEGEAAFCVLLQTLFLKEDDNHKTGTEQTAKVPSLTWRDPESGLIRSNPDSRPLAGSRWTFPFAQEDLAKNRQKIIYYESSRGCPNACSYCLSSLQKGIRCRPINQVQKDLDRLLKADVRQVKFVDRTFNCRPRRALQIWQYLLEKYREKPYQTNFHFEIAGDLLTEEALELLVQAPKGLFQFEIGVQSIQPHVLAAINRSCDLEKLESAVTKLRSADNIHLHLDLIAGLPGETMEQFASSLAWVFALRPHHLQLGFLKILPGTPIAREAVKRGFIWQDTPPYEILASDSLSCDELFRLRDIAQLLEQYWNNNLLPRSLPWLIGRWPGSWEFFAVFAGWLCASGHFQRLLNPQERCRLVWQFGRLHDRDLASGWLGQAWLDLVRLDYYDSGQKDQPAWLGFWEKSKQEMEVQSVRTAKRRFRAKFPETQRCRMEKYHFDLEHLLATGSLRPGVTVVGYELAGQDTCAWRVIMSN